jgi:hypothetical protein
MDAVNDGCADPGVFDAAALEMLSDGWSKHISSSALDRDNPAGKLNSSLPSVINSPSARLNEGNVNVGMKSLNIVDFPL